jgi:hypothetical protein
VRGWRQRIATTAVLLIAVVPSQSKALTLAECNDIVESDYANCKAGEYYSSFGQCENRRAERLVACSQGFFKPLNGSPKDQCLERVESEYRSCGYLNSCTNRWIQGLQQCQGLR